MNFKHWIKKITFLALLFFVIFPNVATAAPSPQLCVCTNSDSSECKSFEYPDNDQTKVFADAAACKTQCVNQFNAQATDDFTDNIDTITKTTKTTACTEINNKTQQAKASTNTPATTPTVPIKDPIIPMLNVPIPGLKFSIPTGSNGTTESTFILDYINAVYKYMLGASIAIAIVMLMVGGLQYTFGGVSSSAIEKAKERIRNALIGLVLLLVGVTLLYTINPQLTVLNSNSLSVIPQIKEDFGSDHTVPNGATVTSTPNPSDKGGLDCSGFKNLIECRKSCVNNLPDSDRSKISNSAYQNSFFGLLDCGHTKGKRTLDKIKVLALHQGKINAAIPTWWTNYDKFGPDKAWGTHYFIDRSGKIEQVIDERFVAWHGVSNEIAIGIDLDAGCSTALNNDNKIATECNYTQAQYNAILTLKKDIESRVGHTLIFKGHCEIGSTTNKNAHSDPWMFDWTKLGESPEAHRTGVCRYMPGYPLGQNP